MGKPGNSQGQEEGGNAPDKPAGSGRTKEAVASPPTRRKLWFSVALCVVAILLLVLHRCDRERPPRDLPLIPSTGRGMPADSTPAPAPEESTATALPEPVKPPAEPSPAKVPKPIAPVDTPKADATAPVKAPEDGQPYLYADPWGGRHFDSVKVTLHCRENCLVLYSLTDSVNFKSYQDPLVFRRNATLWISGIDSLGRQLASTRIDYVIERNPGSCREGNMPVTVGGKEACMDAYEWPNREGEFPRAHVSWQDAADSCASAGKRLCSLEEWRAGCRGPDAEAYPYSGRYNENHCPAKEPAAARSGRFPACRSYFGLYDMTGNLWEWTSTASPDDADFMLVAGGNWNAGNDATCSYAKFSFYPKVRYPFVGFRCCRDAKP